MANPPEPVRAPDSAGRHALADHAIGLAAAMMNSPAIEPVIRWRAYLVEITPQIEAIAREAPGDPQMAVLLRSHRKLCRRARRLELCLKAAATLRRYLLRRA